MNDHGRQALRGILSGDSCVVPASVHDPISARIATDLGFEMAMLGGSVASLAVLGAPDIILLTLSELAEQSHRIARASGIPLLVDADHGYGNALNVRRTVEELEAAGVAGLTIEDTALPPSHASDEAPPLISIREGAGKIAAAVDARVDENTVIVGRSSAARVSGLDEALERGTAYEAEGADAIFLLGLTPSDLPRVAAEISVPLMVSGAGPEFDDRNALADVGVRICVRGHQPFAAATHAVHQTLKDLRDGVAPSEISGLASTQLTAELSRSGDFDDMAQRYLS